MVNDRAQKARTARSGAKPGPKNPGAEIHVLPNEFTDATVPDMPSTADYALSKWNVNTAEYEPVDQWPQVCKRTWELIWTSPVRGKLVEADTLAAELAIWHLSQSVDLSLKPGDRHKHATSYQNALKALGLTPDSRAKLKIVVADAEAAEERSTRRNQRPVESTPMRDAEMVDLYRRHA